MWLLQGLKEWDAERLEILEKRRREEAEMKEMHELGIGSKIREGRGKDNFTMCCTAAAVVWCCSSARDDGDGAAVKIISATNHVLCIHERRGSEGSIW
jgi:hypothetical protein